MAGLTGLGHMLISPSRSFPKQLHLPQKIYVGTHHKTGTMWLQRIFRSFAYYHGLVVIPARDIRRSKYFDIALDGHSQFPLDDALIDYRGIHMIRDPRDLIVSACRYHQTSVERQLHQPRTEFGGLTYQEKINSYSDFGDKLMFEMENSSFKNISSIRSWNYENPRFIEVKYEDLMRDTQLLLFGRIFADLQIPGAAIPSALTIAYNGSLFSGTLSSQRHVTSGRSGDWRKYFEPRHVARFKSLFGAVCEELGYETDSDW